MGEENVIAKSEHMRTGIPCAACLQMLSAERADEVLLCEHCGLKGPTAVMQGLTKMRALVVRTEGALLTRRTEVAQVASTIEACCGNAQCYVFRSGLIAAPDEAPDLACACPQTDLEKLVLAQAEAIRVFRGVA